jgi:hypothetical protein
MPRTTRTAAYGPEYEQLILLAIAEESEKRLKFASPSIAASMKARIYCYWKALRAENLRPDLIEKSNLLSMRCEGADLVIFRREDAWDLRNLRAALGLEKGFADALPQGTLVAKSQTDILVERLQALREEKQKK